MQVDKSAVEYSSAPYVISIETGSCVNDLEIEKIIDNYTNSRELLLLAECSNYYKCVRINISLTPNGAMHCRVSFVGLLFRLVVKQQTTVLILSLRKSLISCSLK